MIRRPRRATSARTRIAIATGVLVSLVLLWWTLHDVELGEVVGHAARAHWLPFALAVLLTVATLPLRAFRWQRLLGASGEAPPVGGLWYATAIGFMANNLLPARTGEIARAYAATRTADVPFPTGVATIAVERVMDATMVLLILCVVLVFGGVGTDMAIAGTNLSNVLLWVGGAVGIVLMGCVAVAAWPGLMVRFGSRLARRLLPSRMIPQAEQLIADFGRGFGALRHAGRTASILGWSAALWGTQLIAYAFGLMAFDITVSWQMVSLLTTVTALGIAIPSTPGFFGPFEAATRASLMIFGVASERAVSFAVTFHLGIFVAVSGVGLWCLSRAHLRVSSLAAARSDLETASSPSVPAMGRPTAG